MVNWHVDNDADAAVAYGEISDSAVREDAGEGDPPQIRRFAVRIYKL